MRKRSRGITQGNIYKAKKKLFVSAVLRDNNIRQAACKSGLSIAEAKAFHRSVEFSEMSGYLWKKYVQKSLEDGTKNLFSSVVKALDNLKCLLDSSNTDTQLRAAGELRQWITTAGKSSVMEKMTSQIMEVGEAKDDIEEEYAPETTRKAMAFLDSYRRTGNGHRVRGGSSE